MAYEKQSEPRIGEAVFLFLAWFILGGSLALWTLGMFALGLMGGSGMLSPIWWTCLRLGEAVLPILLPFGGVPAAIQLGRGRKWKKIALVSFAVCATTWIVLAGVVIFWRSRFGGW
jgi:hypothetical protein